MVNLPRKAVKYSFHSFKVIHKKLMVYLSCFQGVPWHLPTCSEQKSMTFGNWNLKPQMHEKKQNNLFVSQFIRHMPWKPIICRVLFSLPIVYSLNILCSHPLNSHKQNWAMLVLPSRLAWMTKKLQVVDEWVEQGVYTFRKIKLSAISQFLRICELNNILWSFQHFPYSNLELHVLTKYVPEVQLFGIHYFKLWILKEGIKCFCFIRGHWLTTDMKNKLFLNT